MLNEAIEKILKANYYDPFEFFKFYCELNNESIRSQNCSQSFIRSLIKNVNQKYIDYNQKNHLITKIEYNPLNDKDERNSYLKFINSNHIFPQSKAFSIFSIISKSYIHGKCMTCHREIKEYSFHQYIDQNIYLDNIKGKMYFSEVLKENAGKELAITLNCPSCHKENNIKEEVKIVKLPEILIFTLERNCGFINNVEIKPDNQIDMKNYIDESLKFGKYLYELFAINIRYGNHYGHQLCQIKIKGKWYEINDTIVKINPSINFKDSYGLFYKKI